MPEIVRLARCKICVYPGDHLPPHFHVRGPGVRVSIDIVTHKVLRGTGDKAAIGEAVAWASIPEHRHRLLSEWRRLNERD